MQDIIYSTAQKKKKPRFPMPPSEFCPVQLNTLKFKEDQYHINESECFQLEREVIYPLNNKNLLKCFCNSYGVLSIFEIPFHDVIYLNSLLYQLVLLKGFSYGHMHYLRKPNDKNNTAEFIPYDRNTRVFNRYGQHLNKSDFICMFHARVAVAIRGLRLVDGFHIYPELSVYQMKIEDEEPSLNSTAIGCIFD